MDHFYVTLRFEISVYYFPANTIAEFKTKLATPLELIAWSLDYSRYLILKDKKWTMHNTLRLDSEKIIFPVKHYESAIFSQI